MGPALAALAWTLSLAPLALAAAAAPEGVPREGLAGTAAALGGLGLLPLAVLPWAALAGLPGAPPGAGRRRRWPAALALSLPVLAVAARLDRAAGAPTGALALTALGGLLLAALLAEASHRAARAAPPGRGPGGKGTHGVGAGAGGPVARATALHGLAWMALVVAPPALDLVLRVLALGPAAAPRWSAAWMAASPLGWLGLRAVEPAAGGLPLAPLAAALVLLALPPLGTRLGTRQGTGLGTKLGPGQRPEQGRGGEIP